MIPAIDSPYLRSLLDRDELCRIAEETRREAEAAREEAGRRLVATIKAEFARQVAPPQQPPSRPIAIINIFHNGSLPRVR